MLYNYLDISFHLPKNIKLISDYFHAKDEKISPFQPLLSATITANVMSFSPSISMDKMNVSENEFRIIGHSQNENL